MQKLIQDCGIVGTYRTWMSLLQTMASFADPGFSSRIQQQTTRGGENELSYLLSSNKFPKISNYFSI